MSRPVSYHTQACAALLFFVRRVDDDMATGGGLETRVPPLAPSPRSFLIASTKDLSISITGKVNER